MFLDFDGTLADSVGALRGVYDRFLETHGHRGSDRDFEACNGLVLSGIVARLRGELGLESGETELLAQYEGLVREVYDRVPPMPGSEALLRAAAEAQMPVVVVSSAPSALILSWIEAAGLAGLVTDTVGGDHGARGKPEPDPYLVALRRTGCATERSLAVEDSRPGASAAVAAHLPTWVLGPTPGEPWPGVVGFIDRLDQLVEVIAGV